jgi:hypothetical protein
MEKQLFFGLLLAGLFGLQVSAQVPEKAEDISPLLNGETIPGAALTAPDGSSKTYCLFHLFL